MESLLTEPLFYIFAVYGLSFLVMAYFIAIGIIEATDVAVVSSFYVLVIFGTFHGMAELTDWVRFSAHVLGQVENQVLTYTSQVSMIISFVFLLQFGINLLTYKSKSAKKSIIRLIPLVLFIIYLAVVLSMGITDITRIGLYVRYSFGFAGAALSAFALFHLAGSMSSIGNKNLLRGLNMAALGFACYSIVGGLIINPVFGFPIQLFRATCAVVIAISSATALRVFKVE